ncbi:MAG: HAD family hydrolase [Microbacteriaceae bacterium]
MDLYLFDFDETLNDYDFRIRLPALSRVTGVSQYRLAKSWWAAGYERRAEAGEWPTAAEYLDRFECVTGARLTLDEWRRTRALAGRPIPGSIDALRRCATLGTVALLSNNPSPFAESLTELAPEVADVVGGNALISCRLGVRKPDARSYQLALERFGVAPENAFFTDDSSLNIGGARAVGIHAHRLEWIDGVAQVDDLNDAIEAFASRAR